MDYISTRGGMPAARFSDVLLSGLACDGGLVVPSAYPQLDLAQLTQWVSLEYPALAYVLVKLFASDISDAALHRTIVQSYTQDRFRNDAITPLLRLEEGLYLLELFHGPTLAFKDVAMQLLGNLFEYLLTERSDTLNILGATSGDTGSAAEYAMRVKKGIRVFMLSPHGKMSPFQRAQMYSLDAPNIFNLAVHGFFDDCQDMVKAVHHDHDFKNKYRIGAVNSINWGRIVAQVVPYFKAYFLAAAKIGDPVDVVVPCGNFGNMYAGHVAKQMGLPIRNLIVATNENDVLHAFFRDGCYQPRAATIETSSPSMDITRASNLERFVFDLFGRDAARLRAFWEKIESGQAAQLDVLAHTRLRQKYGFFSGSSTHAHRVEQIRVFFQRYCVQIDPHTADACHVASHHRDRRVPMVILATAHPAKFASTLQEALGVPVQRPRFLEGLEDRPQHYMVMNADVDAIKAFLVQCINR